MNEILNQNRDYFQINKEFLKYLRISLYDDKQYILNSNYILKNSQSLYYKNLKPVSGGLFCTKIFGTLDNNACDCNNTINNEIYNII